MALTTAQIMLIDILTDRLITIIAAIAKAKEGQMTDEEIAAETAYWEAESKKEIDRLNSH